MLSNSLPDFKKWFLLHDIIIAISIVMMFFIFSVHADYVFLCSWILIFVYGVALRRTDALIHLFLSSLIATLWVHYAKEFYGYSYNFLTIFGMNTLPLMAWALALLGLSEICNHFKMRRKIYYFLLFVPVYWFVLIFFETLAYHVLEIRNTMTASYSGLPFCDCIHAPTWMKIAYFAMGPVYYSITMIADSFFTNITKKGETEMRETFGRGDEETLGIEKPRIASQVINYLTTIVFIFTNSLIPK